MTTPRRLAPDIFRITTGSSEPIYRQMVEQLRRLSVAGHIQPGDDMPSVREVASELGINPMTVSKSYSQLETLGLLERRRGMGMVVAAHKEQDAGQAERLELLRPGMERLAEEARQLELQPTAVIALLRTIMKGEQK